jgi:putative flippase GtrA
VTRRSSLSTLIRSDRVQRWRTAFRFLVVGGVSTVVTIGLFNLLVHVGQPPLLGRHPVTGYIVAMVAGLLVNYAGNRFWAFGGGAATTRWAEVVGFLLTNAVAVAIPSICLAVSRYLLGLDSAWADNVSANGVGLVLATLSRWVAYRYVVFAHQPTAGEERDAHNINEK